MGGSPGCAILLCVVLFRLPLTVTVSVSFSTPLKNSVKVMVPVSWKPPASVAESVRTGGVALLSVMLVGLGVVLSVGLAGLTATCSLVALLSLTEWLLLSPL